jgi:His-Xaa-Ser system protein HxsD
MDKLNRHDGDSHRVVKVDSTLYSRQALLRTCYKFTERCYIFLSRSTDNPEIILANLTARQGDVDIQLVGEFFNELLDQSIRQDLREETHDIRTLIVAQAFSEGNLLEPDLEDADYEDDPLGIAG